MGTNYYHTRNVCGHCHRGDEPRHIGKSSYGWAFALHVDPDNGIHSLEDWIEIFDEPNSKIFHENDDVISMDKMLAVIVGRRRDEDSPYLREGEWLRVNSAVPDFKNNIARRKIDRVHCIGHGNGTYDYVIGEFS